MVKLLLEKAPKWAVPVAVLIAAVAIFAASWRLSGRLDTVVRDSGTSHTEYRFNR